jgi:microcystin-dependent protein
MEGTIAEIRLFAANFAPRNWAYCAGQIVSIAQNSALFSLLGTTYGGNGQTTFALPDFRGRVAVGTGQGAGLSMWTLGEMQGNNSVVLTQNQLPSHNHVATMAMPLSNGAAGTEISGGYLLATAGGNTYGPANSALSVTMAAQNGVSGMAGGNSPLGIQQPYLGMNYIICQYGIYPSRN